MCPAGVLSVVLTLLVLSFHTDAAGNTLLRRRGTVFHRQKRDTSDEQNARWCGLLGRDGRDGRDGVQGPYGPPGQKGEPGLSGHAETASTLESLKAQLSVLLKNHARSYEEKLEDIRQRLTRIPHDTVTMTDHEVAEGSTEKNAPEQVSKPSGGAVYTRWGRTSCPNAARKLYNGVVVGSHYTHDGSGANYLCLPLNPQWNKTVAGHQSGSYLYGTEFEVSESNSHLHRHNADGKSQHNHDARCSVCHTPGRQSHVMIPARLECPAGWTLEYIGFLMSAHHSHKRSEYVCVDQDPDVHPATSADKNGALFYITEAVCGSLLCPPYVDGFEITCVVCTK